MKELKIFGLTLLLLLGATACRKDAMGSVYDDVNLTWGVYSYNGKDYVYNSSINQLSVQYTKDGKYNFSILDPTKVVCFKVIGIDPNAKVGDEIQVEFKDKTYTVEVKAKTSNSMELQGDGTPKFVVKI